MDYYSTSSSEGEEFEGILKQALEVQITTDFNPNSVPRDGHEFLQHVIYERKKCKQLVTSDVNPDKYTKNRTILLKLDKPLGKSSALVPSKEWQMTKLAQFQDFRYYLHSIMSEDQTITTFDEALFINSIKTELPVYSKLAKLAQTAKIKMLELLSKYISKLEPGMNLDDPIGTWLYAILASLDIPLSPSDCYVIREFAKRCLTIRSNLCKENENCASALNFFICIVGRFYNQLDLADE